MIPLIDMLHAVLKSGMTEKDVAARVKCSQPTIHRIKHGASTDYDKGKVIETLYRERCPVGPEPAPSPAEPVVVSV